MKKIICYLLSSWLFLPWGFSQAILEKKTLYYGEIELLAPKDWKDTVDDNFIAQYPQITASHNFTDAMKTVYFLSAVNDRAIDDNGIPAYTDEFLASLRKQKYIKVLEDGLLLQDGKNLGYVKFAVSKGKLGFHYVFYTSFKDKLVLFQFSCPRKLRSAWETTVEQMANSLRIKTN